MKTKYNPADYDSRWEKEFRKQFGYDNLVGAERERFENQESFISNLLSTQRSELSKEVKEKIIKFVKKNSPMPKEELFGYLEKLNIKK